jgi:hypothetical protein
MLWITNHPKSLKGLWPRRAGCVYIEGEPRGTFAYTAEQLREQGLVGAYVNMPEDEYRKLPIVKNPQDMKRHESG